MAATFVMGNMIFLPLGSLVFNNQSADAEDFGEDAALLHTQDHRPSKKIKSRPKIVKF